MSRPAWFGAMMVKECRLVSTCPHTHTRTHTHTFYNVNKVYAVSIVKCTSARARLARAVRATAGPKRR